jgi:hypothetical protein
MAIKYYLKPNVITPDPNDQSARVITGKVHDVVSITKEMLKRGSTITEADIMAVLKVFFEVTSDEVADGNNVNLPLVNLRPSINGVFSSITDSFDASRHIKRASVTAGTLLSQKMSAAQVEKVTQPVVTPSLIQFLDVTTQNTNSSLTVGGIGQIIGDELKFDSSNPQEGIFFIATDNTATQATIIASKTDGKLVFSIPSLPAGNYILEVRKNYGTTNLVLRSGSLQDTLQVI